MVSKGGKKALRDEKMREIDNYLFEKTKTREKKMEKENKRSSARPKRDKTANLIYSEEQLGLPEEVIEVLDYRKESEPLSRKLFSDEPSASSHGRISSKISNVQTAPQMKMPEDLIPEVRELQNEEL